MHSLFPRQHEEYLRRTLDYSEDSTQPASANSSVSEGPVSPLVLEPNLHGLDVDASHSQEVESLKRLLQEVRVLKNPLRICDKHLHLHPTTNCVLIRIRVRFVRISSIKR